MKNFYCVVWIKVRYMPRLKMLQKLIAFVTLR